MAAVQFVETIVLYHGLDGFDEALEGHIIPLFEQLQLVSAEAASPALDLLTFVHSCNYFGVVTQKRAAVPAPPLDAGKEFAEGQPMSMERFAAVAPSAHERTSMDAGTSAESPWSLAVPSVDEVINNRVVVTNDDIVGFVYLTSSQNLDNYLQIGELSIGVVIREPSRGKGYGSQAVQKALAIAFADPNCYRVQAVLVDTPHKDRALSMFMRCGFGHEGVRRRGFRSPYDFEFKDVTYLGLLATDYVMRGGPTNSRRWGVAPKSMWDELFARHQREREELMRWEDRQAQEQARQKLKRTASTDTIRQSKGKEREVDEDEVSGDGRGSGAQSKGQREASVDSMSEGSAGSDEDSFGAYSRSDVPSVWSAATNSSLGSPPKRRRLGRTTRSWNDGCGHGGESEVDLGDPFVDPENRGTASDRQRQMGALAAVSQWRTQTVQPGPLLLEAELAETSGSARREASTTIFDQLMEGYGMEHRRNLFGSDDAFSSSGSSSVGDTASSWDLVSDSPTGSPSGSMLEIASEGSVISYSEGSERDS